MPTVNQVPGLPDPIEFRDLRECEAAEREKLQGRLLQLKDLPKKRSLTPDEVSERHEIEQKLATDDVVEPRFKAVQQGLTPGVGDHKDGLLPSQQQWQSLLALFGASLTTDTAIPDWDAVVAISGLSDFDAGHNLAQGLQSFDDQHGSSPDGALPPLRELADLFDKFVVTLGAAPKQAAKTLAVNKLADDIAAKNLEFTTVLALAVRQGFVSQAENLIDWVIAVYGGLSQTSLLQPGTAPLGFLTDQERVCAAVFGILTADDQEIPVYHLPGIPIPPDPYEATRKQNFGRALFAAHGEYSTNSKLFDAVLPILVQIGEQGPRDVVSAQEWAQVVRYLIRKGIDEHENQLARKVDEALNNIQNVGVNIPTSQIVIDLPNIDDQTVIDSQYADRIRALQPAYFASMFEEMKAFQVVDKLVELFQNGILPIGRGEAGNNLFKYWKEAASRVSEAERRSFYARSLGTVTGDDGGMPNREFNDLWMRFVSAVSTFVRQNTVDDLLRTRIPGAISQQQVRKSGRDLADNLSLHGFGMAYFMATELQQQVKDIIKLLSDPDIKNAYGARDMWQVIDQVAALELGGAKNSVRYRTMAASGAIIIAWLAKKSRQLASSTFEPILDIIEIQNPSPRSNGSRATTDPTDYDLVNACEQWLAVTGTQEQMVEDYSQPKEAPATTSKPIQIPAIAREMLDSVGVPAMSLGQKIYNRR